MRAQCSDLNQNECLWDELEHCQVMHLSLTVKFQAWRSRNFHCHFPKLCGKSSPKSGGVWNHVCVHNNKYDFRLACHKYPWDHVCVLTGRGGLVSSMRTAHVRKMWLIFTCPRCHLVVSVMAQPSTGPNLMFHRGAVKFWENKGPDWFMRGVPGWSCCLCVCLGLHPWWGYWPLIHPRSRLGWIM